MSRKLTRKNHKRRGGTRRVRFISNINNANNKRNVHAYNRSDYLNELRNLVRKHIPEPSVIQTNDAEIMAAVFENQETPEDMIRAFQIIYNPEKLSEAEYTLAIPILKKRGFGTGINVIDSSPLPKEVKDNILRYVRFARAVDKVHHMFIKNKSNPRFVHEEWGSNKN